MAIYRRESGFTLIEIVMTLLILSVISVVVGRILFQGLDTFTTSNNISEVDWNGYIALDRIVNDIHNIRSAADITTISSTQLVFVDTSGNTVTYQLSGTTLQRNSVTLASGVTGFSLSYLDKNGATTTTPSSTRYILMTVSLQSGNLTTSFTTLGATRGMP